MNALVVYTPTKDWTILWSIMVGIAFLYMKLKADTENRMMEKIRRMDKYADIAKSTDQELDKVTAELNEVNHELETAMNDREEMKLETDKVNTMLLEALKLVYDLDRKTVKSETRVDAIGTLCKSQQEVLVQMDRKLVSLEVKMTKLESKKARDVQELGEMEAWIERLKNDVYGSWGRDVPILSKKKYRKDVDAMV